MNNEEKILQMLTEMNKRFDSLENRFDSLETQTRENTEMLKAVLHNQEIANAEIEGLKLSTVSSTSMKEVQDDIQDVKAGIDTMNTRLFAQEKEITKLKLIK